MLFSLSMKNLKKSIRDYSIYFFTLILGICIFYVFNAIEDQSAMMQVSKAKSDIIGTMLNALSVMSVVVSFILGFLIVYASRFLIRKRKKEFGIYLTLGMKKGDISKILLTETAVIGLISLAAGLLAGIGLSQFMSLFVSNMFRADMSSFVFVVSGKAVVKTICYFVIIYFVVMVMNTFIIARSKLIDLFLAGKKKEKKALKNPLLCLLVFALACIILGKAYYTVTAGMTKLESEWDVAFQIVLGIVGTFLVFWSVSGFLLEILKKIPGIYHRRLNSFVLNEAGSQINTAVAAGSIICLLLFATICILSSAFALKSYKEGNVEYLAPRSVSMSHYMDDEKTVKEILQEKGFDMKALTGEVEITTYRADTVTQGSVMGSHMDKLIEAYAGYAQDADSPVEIIKESDYNRAAKAYGFTPVELGENGYAISCDYESILEEYNAGLKVNDTIEIAGRSLKAVYDECMPGYLMMSYSKQNMGLVIVPDDIAFPEECKYINYLIADYAKGYDTDKFRSYMDDGGFYRQVNGSMEEMEIIIGTQSNIYDDSIGSSGMVVFIALYLGFIFIISGAAILALKEMSDAIDSREKYRVLRQLGAGEREVNRALFTQMLIFFGFPLILAAVHSVFGIQVCREMLSLYNSDKILPAILTAAGMIVLIYGAYFVVSYLCCRRVIRE